MTLFTKLTTAISFLFCVTSLQAQDFYELTDIQTIEITFEQSNWDQLLDNAYPSGEYILAQSVTLNGEVFDSVGVKYKGNSTYQSNQTKNPFHIELDTYKSHSYQGYTDIKLSNIAKDPSFLREVLSYQVLRKYMDAPLSNYANVYVNGQLLGLYSNSEAVSKKFVKSRFGSKSNTFIKCNPIDGAGPQSSDFPDLRYLGQDSTDYYEAYELKSDYGWQSLIDLCDTLSNENSAIDQILDVDRALWMLAFNNATVNLDSYIGAFKQNYYLYRGDYGRFLPVVWDLNESFGKFAMAGTGNLNSTNAKQSLDPFLHDNDSSFPLIQKLLSNPQYKRMYVAHYKTMLEENFENGAYYEVAEILHDAIDEAVLADPNKLFSYNNFLSNIDNDINSGGGGGGGGSTPGIKNLMDGRSNYLLGLAAFQADAPTISNIIVSEDVPLLGDIVTLSTDITAANNVYVGYRHDEYAPFTKVQMTDNGTGTYTADIPVEASVTQYYIYAENDDAGMFSPQRAEHEYHTILSTSSNPILGDLVINEFLASNDITAEDQDGEFDDWVELYNNGDVEIDLSGYYLSDDPTDNLKWTIPTGTVIGAGDYLIIWTDDDEEQEGLHATFKLSAAGESVILSDTDGTILDEVTYINQVTDISYGRFPNGTGDFTTMTPTFDSENMMTVSVEDIDYSNAAVVYPNPVNTDLHIELSNTDLLGLDLLVYDLYGRVVYSSTASNYDIIDASDWSQGLYLLKIGGYSSKIIKN